MNVLSLFSGYDAPVVALQNLGINVNLVAWADINKYAIAAHNALFPKWASRNIGDVSAPHWPNWSVSSQDIDMLTYTFPCQDLSRAGKRAGMVEGSGTRSSLLWCVKQYIERFRPRVLLMENVTAVQRGDAGRVLERWFAWLNDLGYITRHNDYTGCDFGVPQIRKRFFAISAYNALPNLPGSYARVITNLSYYLGHDDANLYLSPKTLAALIARAQRTKSLKLHFLSKYYGICVAITTSYCCRATDNYIVADDGGIRRLSPWESLRLMGLTGAQADSICAALSRRGVYHVAGNSIIVPVLEAIFNANRHLLI